MVLTMINISNLNKKMLDIQAASDSEAPLPEIHGEALSS